MCPLIEMPLNMKKTEIQLSYTASNLVAELGGFLGLYIGASLLTTGQGWSSYTHFTPEWALNQLQGDSSLCHHP
jgi:hypothetical protein